MGGGAYNYNRNLTAEQSTTAREFEHFSDAQLEELIDAYSVEVARLRLRLEGIQQRRPRPQRVQSVDRGIRQFERVQESGINVRAANAQLTERQIALEKLQEEQRVRSDPYFEARRFLELLTRI